MLKYLYVISFFSSDSDRFCFDITIFWLLLLIQRCVYHVTQMSHPNKEIPKIIFYADDGVIRVVPIKSYFCVCLSSFEKRQTHRIWFLSKLSDFSCV